MAGGKSDLENYRQHTKEAEPRWEILAFKLGIDLFEDTSATNIFTN